MFERETDTILTTARQRIPHSIFDASSVMLKDIIAADVPHPLKTFFRADVELALAEELNRIRKESRFNHRHPEVEALQQQMNSVLVMHYAFTREEFLHRLDDAVHMLINYLVRPQWTLTNVLFETEERISSTMLLRMLRYFGPYEYLRSLLLRYIEERNIAGFTRQEFSTLLWKVDGHFLRRKTGIDAAKMLTPLYDFIAFPASGAQFPMPVKALAKFCNDKGFAGAVRLLEDEAGRGTAGLTQRELGEMLERLRRASGAFEVDIPTAAEFDRPARASQLADQAAGGHTDDLPPARPQIEPESEDPAPPTPITFTWAQEQTEQQPDESEDGSVRTEEANAPVSGRFDDEPLQPETDLFPATKNAVGERDEPVPPLVADQPDPAVETSQSADHPPDDRIETHGPPRTGSVAPSLFYVMSEGDRKKFIKKIFLGDYNAFVAALRNIDELPTWRQASVFIDEIFIENDIDPYLPEAVRFIDIVQEKYYPRK